MYFWENNMTSTFLTREEIVELTGVKHKSTQLKQLAEQGVKFILGRDGHPKVLRKSIEERLGNSVKAEIEHEPILFKEA